jgi:protein-S-isoprenylcysteine O-methyltransferase Ste14
MLLLKNILFTLVVPGTVAVYVPLFIVEDRSAVSGIMFAVALVLVATGGVIYGWCVWDFAVLGRGTPAPIDAPKKLVVRGLYRYTRNPMYVGVLTVLSGWAVLFQAAALIIYTLVVGACCHGFVVFYEERHLHKVFGSEYDDYRRRVGRWLPKIRRTPAA